MLSDEYVKAALTLRSEAVNFAHVAAKAKIDETSPAGAVEAEARLQLAALKFAEETARRQSDA